MKISLASIFIFLVAAGFVYSTTPDDIQPPLMSSNPPAQVLFKESEAAVLLCKANGQPKPTYTWKKDGQDFDLAGSGGRIVMRPNEGTLVLEEAEKKDAGSYQCFANNSYGVAMSGIVELRLAFLQPLPNQRSQNIDVLPGASLRLPCHRPVSYPEANVTWILEQIDGSFKIIDFTDRIVMDHEGNLIFVNVLEEDSYTDTSYTCLAMNSIVRRTALSEAFYLRTIQISGKPQHASPHIISAGPNRKIFLKGDTMKLQCILGGHPTTKIRWYWKRLMIKQNAKYKLSSFNHHLNVLDATFEDEGQYECYGISSFYSHQIAINVKVDSKPEWTMKPKSVVTSPGGSATFTCNGTSKPPINKVMWYINGVEIYRLPNKTKFIVEETNLTVINLTHQDSMTIQCNISNIHGYLFSNVFLKVLDTQPPQMIINPPTQVFFYEPETVTVPCKANGQPQPMYTWKKDGQDFDVAGSRGRIFMRPNEGTLVFKQTEKKDAGSYQCFANNSYGVAMSGVELRLAFLQPFPNQESQTITVLPGASLRLPCHRPVNYPDAKVTWVLKEKDGRTKTVNFTERILMDREGNLIFSNVLEEDSYIDAAYTCLTSRFARNLTVGRHFILKTIPMQPEDHQPHVISVSPDKMIFLKGATIKLQCIFGGHPTPYISWYRSFGQNAILEQNAKNKFSSFKRWLDVLDSRFEDEGNYECHAQAKGFYIILQQVIQVKIESKPEWTMKPKSVVTSPGGSVSFFCNGTSKPPINKVVWYINGVEIYQHPIKTKFIVEETNLTVINLTHQDSMTIQCNISNIHGYISSNVFLKVLGGAPEMREETEKTLKISEGQTINITCKTTGYDSVHTLWWRDNKQLTDGRYRTLSNGNLNIKNLILADAGIYRCEAINMFGMVSATRTLIVRQKTTIIHSPVDTSVKERADTKFMCVATTHPMEVNNLQIIWFKDGKSIDLNDERITQDSPNNTLVIKAVTQKDAGRYTCVATNGLDWTKTSAFLYVCGHRSC